MFHKEDRNGIELEFPNKKGEVEPVLEEIKRLIEENKISCVVMEATQGDGGGVSMQPDFFIELMKLSLDYQFPVVVDEVQSGFGRSGRIFDVEYLLDYWRNSSYVRNDGYPENPPFILAVAKSMTNGAVPGSAVIFPKEYAVLKRAQGLNTYSAHPTTLAATLATVSLMTPELLEMVHDKRQIFEELLEPYVGPDKHIKGFRGHGLHLFLDLGENDNQLLQVELIGTKRILTGTVARNALRIHPPLNTPNDVLGAIAHAIEETSLRLQEGWVSPQTLQILKAGPSELAKR
jgi:acetylornithine/succinyldiaminopimelate/putrescine aminotransferase